jgi:hypothetical protein
MAFLAPLAEAAAPAVIGSLLGGAGNAVQNGAMGAINGWDEAFQTGLYAEQVRHQEHMALQSSVFDEAMDERAERMREVNTLRDVQMAQRRADNQITKKFIQMISE